MQSMRFKIEYKENKLICENYSLSNPEFKYIDEYLTKVNKYKIIAFWEGSPLYSLYQPPLASRVGEKTMETRLKRKFQLKRIPASATISLTKACQCECDHCSAVFYNHSKERQLTSLQLQAAIKETVELGVSTIILLGGEPLLQKDIYKIIESIPKEEASVILFTNGEYLTPDNCKRLKDSGLLGAFVSIDTPNAEEHDSLRHRTGLFQKAMKGIENMNLAGLVPGISSYLSPERVLNGGFYDMMELGKNSGAKEVTFFDAIPSGRWLRDESHLLKEEDRLKIKEIVKEFRRKEDYPGMSVQSTMTSECGSAFCFAANTQFYLTAFGELCPCDFTPISIGKFPENSISELWDKLIHTAPYHKRSKVCRMQNKDFRDKYIYKIPKEGPYPYPLEQLNV